MSLYVEGLSSSDISGYYAGSYLETEEGDIMKVSEGTRKFLVGHIATRDGWAPAKKPTTSMSLFLPKEGYYQVQGYAVQIEHILRRSRKKSMSSESYRIRAIGGDGGRSNPSLSARLVLSVRRGRIISYTEGIAQLKIADSVALSRSICLSKAGNNVKSVLLRGQEVGTIRKGILALPKKYKLFEQELKEFSIPMEIK